MLIVQIRAKEHHEPIIARCELQNREKSTLEGSGRTNGLKFEFWPRNKSQEETADRTIR